MVDEIYTVIPGKQVIALRLRENANQYFKKKRKFAVRLKKLTVLWNAFKGFLKVLKVYFHGSIKHLQDHQEVNFKKKQQMISF